MKSLVIVNAGLGDPSTTRQVAERVGDAVVRRVTAAGEGLEVRRIDLRDLASDLATYMTTYIPSEALDRARRTVSAADGLIVATPVFQGSYSGLFKMFFDTLEMRSLEEVPVTMVATAGTARHSMVLDYAVRPLLSFLHALVLPTGVFADTAEFGADSGLSARIERAAGELARQLTAVRGVRGFTGDSGAPDGAASAGKPRNSRPVAGEALQGDGGADFRVPEAGFASLLAGHSGS
ncbi:MAG: NAD(P)H-dependent oxidoreductase [Corynebacterium provencense]|jgi:FMN reductase|uniref:CE1759 family FMN reductase n=1 Tax=Corynebacterium provencense TaxID=1737425 RepID=UPI002989FD41|nr:NAD(P)H-dependent oxidoreductase [Corynebacterium provencense]